MILLLLLCGYMVLLESHGTWFLTSIAFHMAYMERLLDLYRAMEAPATAPEAAPTSAPSRHSAERKKQLENWEKKGKKPSGSHQREIIGKEFLQPGYPGVIFQGFFSFPGN